MATSSPVVLLANGQPVGGESPCFIIAEIGQNHQGNVSIAKDLILAAKCGDWYCGNDPLEDSQCNLTSVEASDAEYPDFYRVEAPSGTKNSPIIKEWLQTLESS
ncbi:hypothetical protein J6590_027481 [Homalodisca vitripennis]|nr:hypothetical protein J6590_027481 [Homalodisca vitripennis]